jgi:hypothetical protein
MGLLLWPEDSEVQRTGLKAGHYTSKERLGGSIFLETERVAATRPFSCERVALRNGFVSEVGPNESGPVIGRELNRSHFGRQAPV